MLSWLWFCKAGGTFPSQLFSVLGVQWQVMSYGHTRAAWCSQPLNVQHRSWCRRASSSGMSLSLRTGKCLCPAPCQGLWQPSALLIGDSVCTGKLWQPTHTSV